jgi:hypothetical protein
MGKGEKFGSSVGAGEGRARYGSCAVDPLLAGWPL